MNGFAIAMLALAGFAAIAVSMAKHHKDMFGGAPAVWTVRACRAIGWLCFVASLLLSTAHMGVATGIVFWFGAASFAALGATLLLTYRTIWWRS